MPPRTLSPTITRVQLLALVLLTLLARGTAHAQSASVIDVAVFYTSAAKTVQGGTAQIEAKVDELVAATNLAYADSDVDQTINLVAVEEVVGYTRVDNRTDLHRLRNKADGYMDEVHSIRDRVRADAVILLNGGSVEQHSRWPMSQRTMRPTPLAFPPPTLAFLCMNWATSWGFATTGTHTASTILTITILLCLNAPLQ